MDAKNKGQRLLSRYLRRTGLTMTELADELGVSPAHMSNVKNGNRKVSQHLAKRISDVTSGPWMIAMTSWGER